MITTASAGKHYFSNTNVLTGISNVAGSINNGGASFGPQSRFKHQTPKGNSPFYIFFFRILE
jgi:hypothetical protein